MDFSYKYASYCVKNADISYIKCGMEASMKINAIQDVQLDSRRPQQHLDPMSYKPSTEGMADRYAMSSLHPEIIEM